MMVTTITTCRIMIILVNDNVSNLFAVFNIFIYVLQDLYARTLQAPEKPQGVWPPQKNGWIGDHSGLKRGQTLQ